MDGAHFTRRDFLAMTGATGFALAVEPVSAESLTTEAGGLVAGDVKIPVGDATIPAYRPMPDTKSPFPVVRMLA